MGARDLERVGGEGERGRGRGTMIMCLPGSVSGPPVIKLGCDKISESNGDDGCERHMIRYNFATVMIYRDRHHAGGVKGRAGR